MDYVSHGCHLTPHVRQAASRMSKSRPLFVLLLLPPIGVGSLQQAGRPFLNASCHVAFRYPVSWTVQPETTQPDRVCLFQLRATAWDSLLIEADSVQDVHTIRLEVLTEPFEEVLPTSAFERRDGGWVVGGRWGLESPATSIEGRGWRGVRGDAPVGCYRLAGGYVGACEVPMALVGAGTYTIVVEGGPGTWEIFDRILATLEIRE